MRDGDDVRRLDLGYFVRPAEETGTGQPRVEPCLGYVVRLDHGVLVLDTGMGGHPAVDERYRPVRRPLQQALGDVGLELTDDAVPLYSLGPAPATCLVIGHEDRGLSPAGLDFTPPLPAAPAISATKTDTGLLDVLFKLNPIREYNNRFEQLIGLTPEEKHRRFQVARTGFPLRHEHPCCRVDEALLEKYPVLKSLGFAGKQG
jgi:hypothetical protein